MVEAAAGRTEKERKIPADVLSAMHACGLFHMLLPVSLGGGAVDLVTFNQVVEALAAADASPGWCLAQAAASSHAAGFLDPKVAREVFGAPDALIAWGPPAGVAKAIAVDGGYRVTGKWRFSSGRATIPTDYTGKRQTPCRIGAFRTITLSHSVTKRHGEASRRFPSASQGGSDEAHNQDRRRARATRWQERSL